MTYIIGARCVDGVVLIADRKILRGTTPFHREKLIDVLPSVIIGGAGAVGLIDRFSEDIKQRVNLGEIQDHNQLLEYVEDQSLIMYDRYPQVGSFQMLIGLQNGNRAQLYNILPNVRFAEPVKQYFAIGSGTEYGSLLLQKFWNDNITMKNFAKVATLSINYVIESNLDDAVGGNTSVWFIPDILESFKDPSLIDSKYVIRKATLGELEEMKVYSDEKLAGLAQFLDDLVKEDESKLPL